MASIANPLSLVALLSTAIGATLLAALFWLNRRARRVLRAQQALCDLNLAQERDALRFLRAAWPVLANAGALGWQWRCQWYGQEVAGESGRCGDAFVVERQVTTVALSATLRIWCYSGKGEDRLLAEALLGVVALLVESDFWLQQARVEEGLAHAERLRTILVHEVKNLAQSVQLLASQWDRFSSEAAFPQRELIGEALAHARERAQRVMRQLTLRPCDQSLVQIDVANWLVEAAKRRNMIVAQCSGTSLLAVPADLWAIVFDNFFDNLLDEARRTHRTQVRVCFRVAANEEAVTITLWDPDAAPPPSPERLLQPFWSSSGGMGLGLKQAQWLVNSAGGQIHLDPHPPQGGLRITVVWPLVSKEAAPT